MLLRLITLNMTKLYKRRSFSKVLLGKSSDQINCRSSFFLSSGHFKNINWASKTSHPPWITQFLLFFFFRRLHTERTSYYLLTVTIKFTEQVLPFATVCKRESPIVEFFSHIYKKHSKYNHDFTGTRASNNYSILRNLRLRDICAFREAQFCLQQSK